MTEDPMKRRDQIALLEVVRTFTDTGVWNGLFTYVDCGADLLESGLATDDKKITMAGRAALYLLGKGDDPIPTSRSYQEFSLPLQTKEK